MIQYRDSIAVGIHEEEIWPEVISGLVSYDSREDGRLIAMYRGLPVDKQIWFPSTPREGIKAIKFHLDQVKQRTFEIFRMQLQMKARGVVNGFYPRFPFDFDSTAACWGQEFVVTINNDVLTIDLQRHVCLRPVVYADDIQAPKSRSSVIDFGRQRASQFEELKE